MEGLFNNRRGKEETQEVTHQMQKPWIPDKVGTYMSRLAHVVYFIVLIVVYFIVLVFSVYLIV